MTFYPSTPLVIRLPCADVVDRTVIDEDVVQRQLYHEQLPAPRPDVLYIVSRKVAYAYANVREDMVFPDTEDGAERDETGRVTAVRRFRRPDKLVV